MPERETQKQSVLTRTLHKLERGIFGTLAYVTTEDLLKIVSDPNFSDQEITQLLIEPEKRELTSRWRTSRWKPGRVLTEEERNMVVDIMFQKAGEYQGDAKIKMFNRLMRAKHQIGDKKVVNFVVKAVNSSDIPPHLLASGLGEQHLLKVNRVILDKKIYKEKDQKTMHDLLIAMGVISPRINKENQLPPFSSESAVEWLSSAVYSLEQIQSLEKDNQLTNYYDLSSSIREFFASFPYESALPFIIQAMESNFVLDKNGRRVRIDEKVIQKGLYGKQDISHGGWRGTYEGYREFLYDEVERTYAIAQCFPIADGVSESLQTIAANNPNLRSEAEIALEKYRQKYNPQPHRTETFRVNVETADLGTTTTYEDHTYC